ncbi:MAG: sporulation transcriptional regulator SpoIIID, partial [Clostridia bacterium]
IENNSTVRQTAKEFGISKSTVHKDLSVRLKEMSKPLYSEVKVLLETNKRERHIRGGQATRLKYLKLTKNNIC